MYCKNCGAVIPDSASFCDNCGARVMPAQQPYTQPAQQQNYQQPYAQPAPQQPNYQQPYAQPAQQPNYQQPYAQPAPQQPSYRQPYAQQYRQQQYAQAPVQPAENAPVKKKGVKKGVIGAVIAAAVLVIAAVLGFLLFSSPRLRAQAYLHEFYKVFGSGVNAKKVINLSLPPKMIRKSAVQSEITVNELYENSQKEFDELNEGIKAVLGDKTVKFKEKYKSSKTISSSKDGFDPDSVKEAYEEEYGVKISEFKKLTYSVTVTFDGKQKTADLDVFMYKVGLRWYVLYIDSDKVESAIYYLTGTSTYFGI